MEAGTCEENRKSAVRWKCHRNGKLAKTAVTAGGVGNGQERGQRSYESLQMFKEKNTLRFLVMRLLDKTAIDNARMG